MKIRPFLPSDFDHVCALLISKGVEPPATLEEIAGLDLVAEEDGQIVGNIYALLGQSTKAYVDFFAVKDGGIGGQRIALQLVLHLETVMRIAGKTRYDFYVEQFNERFKRIASTHGAKRLRDLSFFRMEL